MKNKLFKLLALLFSSSMVVLLILYQIGSFDSVEVYNLNYPNQSKNHNNSTIENQSKQSVPVDIKLPKEQNVVIQFDGKYQEKEEQRTRLMSSKTIIFPREKTLLEKYFEFEKVND